MFPPHFLSSTPVREVHFPNAHNPCKSDLSHKWGASPVKEEQYLNAPSIWVREVGKLEGKVVKLGILSNA